MKILLIILTLIFSNLIMAENGGEGGNGGNPIRLSFINIGKKILQDYRVKIESVVGKDHLLLMKNKLSISYLRLESNQLFDNAGSLVSATGDTSKIVLYVGQEYPDLSWASLLKQTSLAQKLVLHEMLRLAGINDDNYTYSNQIIIPTQQIEMTQIIQLSPEVSPFSSSDMLKKGRHYKPDSVSLCGNSDGYQITLTTSINCDQKTFTCVIREVWSDSFLMNLKVKKNELNQNIISQINSNNTKGTLSCDYQREKTNDCENNSEELISSMDCSLLLSDELKFDGSINFLTQQQQQQQQQQSNNNSPKAQP